MPELSKTTDDDRSAANDEEPPSSGGFSNADKSRAGLTGECHTGNLQIEIIVDQQVSSPAELSTIRKAVRSTARKRGFQSGDIGIRITDDESIQVLNDRHLGHDYATDVISFSYRADEPTLEGELVVSVDTAAREAAKFGWTTENELLLYIVHGVLHITGMDDHEPADRSQMREAEKAVFLDMGIQEINRCGADTEANGSDA